MSYHENNNYDYDWYTVKYEEEKNKFRYLFFKIMFGQNYGFSDKGFLTGIEVSEFKNLKLFLYVVALRV